MVWAGYSEKGQGGEERGPSTFTFVPPSAVQSQAGPQGQAVDVRMGMQGNVAPGLTATVPNIDRAGADQTLGMLNKVANEIFEPHLKKIRQERFMTGMQRAASGEAMTDIANEQPWYSKIFGDAPMVEGARAYTVESAVGSWAATQEQKMDELKTKSPESIPRILAESMKGLTTGDTATDAMIQGKATAILPQLMKRQTKEHYKYQQENMSRQRVSAIETQASLLNFAQTATPGVYTGEEIQQRKDALLAVSTPTLGADPEAWEKDLATAMGLMAEKGNFHGVAAFREAGVVARMNPEKRLAVEGLVNRYEAHHAAEAAIEYSDRISQIKEDAQNGVISAKMVHKRYDELNTEYAYKSGNSQPLIRKGDYVADERAAMSAVVRSQRAAATSAAGQADVQAASYAIMGAVHSGGAMAIQEMGGKEAALLKNTFHEQWKTLANTNPDVANRMLTLNAPAGYRNDYVFNTVQSLVNSVGDAANANLIKAYDIWKRMEDTPGGAAAQARYFGEADKRMAEFHRGLGGRPLFDQTGQLVPDGLAFAEQAWQATNKGRNKVASVNKDEKTEIAKFVEKKGPSMFAGWFVGGRGGGFTDSSLAVIKNAVQQRYAEDKDVLSGEQLLNKSLEKAKASGLEIIGGHAWHNGRDQKPLTSYFSNERGDAYMDQGQISDAMTTLMKELAERAGASPQKYTLLRGHDRDGQAQFTYYPIADDGSEKPIVFSSRDIRQVHERAIPKAGPAAYPAFRAGAAPARPVDQMPSIYATEAEWAAYRKQQKVK